jgi:hypothetical protein
MVPSTAEAIAGQEMREDTKQWATLHPSREAMGVEKRDM